MKTFMSGCDVVFHLAALIAIPYSYHAPGSYVDTNVAGTLHVLQAALSSGVERVLHTSTSEVYGTARTVPIDEEHPLQGQSPYSASKIAADKIAESFYLSFDLPVVTVRPFNTFGPRQSARAIIPTVLSQLARGQESIEVGSLDPVRDFTFVKDTARGFLALARAEAAIGQVTNLGTGSACTIGELIETCQDVAGTRAEIRTSAERIRPDKSEVMKLVCDATRAKETAGWEARTTLREGLAETLAFVREHPELFHADRYTI